MGWRIPGVATARERLGSSLFERVAGPAGTENRSRIHGTPGPRWFGEDRPIRTVHGDASMFIGGLSALLLQSLHPLAMSAVAAHSGYRGDPWGRLQRTSTFLAMTTYGAADDAQRAVDHVRGVHQRVRGRTAAGETYHAADPHLLAWVHVAEVDSFMRAHQRYGAQPLTPAGYDGYVADTARVGSALGVLDPPRDRRELAERIAAYRPELRATPEAADAARFLLLHPPLPLAARLPYAVLAASAVALLPSWAREPLHLPRLPVLERTGVRWAGTGLTSTIRWAMAHRPAEAPSARGGA
ncbi:hypothetical protein GCM10012287_03810 [Streptomyces daqingensis]|uniref:ER-bound oxygenase mpaB/mpaB'/Rubber oxygenase catalytic domain-containing protein n=1 Tax=Streptomyces daqingensis TaxID=1472640 RepID=A0ABQ2LSJ7_9ACTN|nr:oxygenase MpaB family protein [Streptomyces daqingensis]GGO42585.1 hypothetical protein GCM10012287_03810 [Streptomyces daqingensis]